MLNRYVLSLLLVAAVLLPAAAHAHKVNIFAYAEGGRVHTESYYADGGRCMGTKVTVEDISGRQLIEGTTDEEGRFSFDIPAVEDLRVVVHAGMGHKNDYVIKEGELADAMPGKQGAGAGGQGSEKQGTVIEKAVKPESAEKTETPGAGGPSKEAAAKTGGTAAQGSASLDEMRAVVDEVVEARLRPVMGMLAEMKERSDRPTLQDTISGIGYIMGILALILYFRSKRK